MLIDVEFVFSLIIITINNDEFTSEGAILAQSHS